MFHLFAGRISLHHAHLAHALGQRKRALECYRVASKLSEDGDMVGVVAKAGEISIRLAELQARKEASAHPADPKGKGKGRARTTVMSLFGAQDWKEQANSSSTPLPVVTLPKERGFRGTFKRLSSMPSPTSALALLAVDSSARMS